MFYRKFYSFRVKTFLNYGFGLQWTYIPHAACGLVCLWLLPLSIVLARRYYHEMLLHGGLLTIRHVLRAFPYSFCCMSAVFQEVAFWLLKGSLLGSKRRPFAM